MVRDELRNTLAGLHDQLGHTSDVDAETRELLLSVTADIERILADDKSPAEVDESLTQRLEDTMRRFEANHPMIGGLLQRLSDGLANLGI
jgi:hypothetical protein